MSNFNEILKKIIIEEMNLQERPKTPQQMAPPPGLPHQRQTQQTNNVPNIGELTFSALLTDNKNLTMQLVNMLYSREYKDYELELRPPGASGNFFLSRLLMSLSNIRYFPSGQQTLLLLEQFIAGMAKVAKERQSTLNQNQSSGDRGTTYQEPHR